MSRDAENLSLRIATVVSILIAVGGVMYGVGAWKATNEKNWEIQKQNWDMQYKLNDQLQASIKENRGRLDDQGTQIEKTKSALDELRNIVLAGRNASGSPASKTGLNDHTTRPEQGN